MNNGLAYRVLDFGTAQATPVLGLMLSEMGMEVIKVESRTRLDGVRLGRPIGAGLDDAAGGDQGRWPDLQPNFHNHNRGKLGITLNLKKADGMSLMRDLVRVSDIVIDNFSPGVMKRLGLDHSSARLMKPDIITVSLTGAGEYGPLKDTLLYAATIQSMSGFSSLIGYEGEPLIGMSELAVGDAHATIHAAVALMAALWHRTRTGEGQHVELSETEALTSSLGEPFMEHVLNGRDIPATGNRHCSMAPHGNYRCKGEDEWLSISIGTDEEWAAFCSVVDGRWTSDDRLRDAFRRLQAREELDRLVTAWTIGRSPQEATSCLQEAGVAAFPVLNIEGQFHDKHFRERGTYVEIEHPLAGHEVLYSMPWHFSETPVGNKRPAPSLGEHNDYVFGELLGLDEGKTRDLVKAGVIC